MIRLSLCLLLLTLAAAQTQPQKPATPPPEPGVVDTNDPLLQPPPLPAGNPSLVGGTIVKVDRVRETLVVRPYGGGSMKIFFDERSHIYRDGAETTMLGLHKGDRVYVDTLLDRTRVFAKNIRVETQAQPADARGQVIGYDAGSGRLEVRDSLSSKEITFHVAPDTAVRHRDQAASPADLRPGAIVDVRFAPVGEGRNIAREITVIAAPGSVFTFAGKVTYLDMSRGLLALHNSTDNKTYDIHFDPRNSDFEGLGVGSDVSLTAVFSGSQYTATSIIMTEAKTK